MHLKLWLPDEPVPAGGWVPATVIATNEGGAPIGTNVESRGRRDRHRGGAVVPRSVSLSGFAPDDGTRS